MNRVYPALFLLLAGCASLIPLKVGEPPDLSSVEITEKRVQRGEYLANDVMLCMHCHSEIDWNYKGGVIREGQLGSGGEEFQEWFGVVYGSNITPSALESWSDGEVAQAITEGVHPSGAALFPVMPYPLYKILSKNDLYAVIAYIRTLEPVESSLPDKKLKFPFQYIERTIPEPYRPTAESSLEDNKEYGRYLSTIGDCLRCHTPMDKKGQIDESRLFAGGNEFKVPTGVKVSTPNISSDVDDGIGGWTKEDFVDLFKEHKDPEVIEPELNTNMAWSYFAGMTEEDLGAIYDYIFSLPPMKNED